MSTVVKEMWASKLTDETEVTEAAEMTRGLVTFRAYKKLTLLPENAGEKKLVEYFDGLYGDWRDENDDFGEIYVMPPMSHEFGPIELYHMFRKAYRAWSEPWMPLWGQYKLAEYNLPEAGSVRTTLVGDEDNEYGEAGLYLTSRDVATQRIDGKKKIEEFNRARRGLELNYLDPVSYILLDAIRLESGQKPLDKPTWTRFVGMPDKMTIGSPCVPDARWLYDGLNFDWTDVYSSYDRSGVRFSVGKS